MPLKMIEDKFNKCNNFNMRSIFAKSIEKLEKKLKI